MRFMLRLERSTFSLVAYFPIWENEKFTVRGCICYTRTRISVKRNLIGFRGGGDVVNPKLLIVPQVMCLLAD